MKKQRVVEDNLRKNKEADQRHVEQEQDLKTSFFESALGKRLKNALLKMITKKMKEEQPGLIQKNQTINAEQMAR